MKITTTNTYEINEDLLTDMNIIACAAFGQNSEEEMLPDTIEHIQAAEQAQLAYIDDRLAGFALYRRCLWR